MTWFRTVFTKHQVVTLSTTFEPEGDVWLLADLLDCNGAPLDVDTNGDGSFDAYRALIAAEFERVALVPRP